MTGRFEDEPGENLETGDLTLNQATREVRRGSRPITLTRTEFTILELLMRHAGRVLSRDTLIETVWGGDSDIESNTLDAFMRLLRAKVEAPGEPKLLHTIRGVGFSASRKQMKTPSTRARLMLWYSGVLLCALAFFSVEIYSRLQTELLKDVDQELVAEARGVKAVFEIEGITEATLAEEMGEFVKEVPQGELLQLATDSGVLLWPQATPPVFPVSLMSATGERTVESGLFGFYVTTFESKNRTYVILAGESLDDIRRLMARLQVIVLATAAGVLCHAAWEGYWLSRRALTGGRHDPAARSISLESLSKRLPEPRTGDEIERLAKAWNDHAGAFGGIHAEGGSK